MGEEKAQSAARGRELLPDGVKYYKKDFWSEENLRYSVPHFRMHKVARVIRRLTRDRMVDVLDVGCGPGTLGTLLPSNVHYYGIDISIPEPADNFLEADILKNPVDFKDMKFDLVVAQGLFEYIGEYQSQKFAEIAAVLKDDGRFVLTYQNFDHRQREIYWPYSNVQRRADFHSDLSRFFKIERWFAVAHNWNHGHPRRRVIAGPQEHLNIYVPIISPKLSVDYLYICSPLR
jgi:SAM-dependent methyltransferase